MFFIHTSKKVPNMERNLIHLKSPLTIFSYSALINTLLISFSGYVDGLKKPLFTFPKEKREEIIKKYASISPEPLSWQFSERFSKGKI